MVKGREKSVSRKMKQVFLVFCEGETEENYINFLRRKYKSPIKIVPKTEGTKISQHLINKCQKELQLSKNDQITTFLMYDLDVATVVEKLKSCKAIGLFSNPCIELWFLLHFKDQKNALTTKQCLQTLKNSHVDWNNYEKSQITEVQKKILWENKSVAIKRAKTLAAETNPSSSVYQLLEAIENFSK